jgi:hypothetical protein
MLDVNDVTKIVNEIERKIENGEYERKIEYGLAYKVSSRGEYPELYVIVGESKYENLLAAYISPEEPRYNLILEEYGLDYSGSGIIFLRRSKIYESERLKTSETWDERLVLAHELGHYIFRKSIIEPALHDDSPDSKRKYETIKSLYALLHLAFQINKFIYSQEVYNELKKRQSENSNLSERIRELDRYSQEVYSFSMDALKNFMTLNEAYAIATEILTALEWVKNNKISRVHAVRYLNNQFELWKLVDIHFMALSKIFYGLNKNSWIWQLMDRFLKYNQISEDALIKELEKRIGGILREAEYELHKFPDKAGKKLNELVEKRVVIENNLETLKMELYRVL